MTSASPLRRIASPIALAAAIAAVLVVTWIVDTQPQIAKRELLECTMWAALMLTSFAGWGALLDRALFRTRRADLGLRVIWGASLVLFAGGVLGAVSLVSRGVLVWMVLLGNVSAIAHVFLERDANYASVRFAWRIVRKNWLVSIVLGAVLFAALVRFFGGASDAWNNPYDDDVAYLPMVKRLVQTGTLIEPFSFRRLSAMGGVTFFQAMLLPHATWKEMNTWDRSISVALFVVLVLFHKQGKRRLPLFLTALTLGFLLSLPNISINTAAHYAGLAFFLGMYRTLAWIREDDRLTAKAVPLALVAAATCTLRQNYLSVPVVMLAASYAYRIFGRSARGLAWATRLREPLVVAGASIVALLPWFVLGYRSNQTFLFPLQNGTFRHALELQSPTLTWLHEVQFLFSVVLENEPIKAMGLIALAGAVVEDDHPYKPLRSFWISSALGLVILSHSFTLSDAGNLARYLFGFFAALATATILLIGTKPFWRTGTARTRVAAFLALGAMIVQLPYSRERSAREYSTMIKAIDEQRRRPPVSIDTIQGETFVYADLQAHVPAGAPMAVMVDDTYLLDFARNPIFNIDMPGYASLKPDMPYFQGPEPVASYFLAHGIRYVMFVRPEFSHYLYQREFWFARMFNEEEIWRLVAPYFLDIIDSFTALAKTRRIVHEVGGIVVLDLGGRQ